MKRITILVILAVLIVGLNYFLSHTLGIGFIFFSPSPHDPLDASDKCTYQSCKDKCFKQPYDGIPCPKPSCNCADSDKFYCVYKNSECVKKTKPKCIAFAGFSSVHYYLCNDFKTYKFKPLK